MVSLTDGDIDDNKIRVIGKGNKERHIPLIPSVKFHPKNTLRSWEKIIPSFVLIKSRTSNV